jgi:acyl dehydratase
MPAGDVVELNRAPAAAALYWRAVRGSMRRRTEAVEPVLPVTELRLPGAGVDVERLAAYNRVCGLRLADTLPPTYPHVVAFGLALWLMSTPDFPFPVLGLVHVANRISQGRPVHVAERLDFTVRTASLRPHPRGQQFDVVATATVAGIEVWHGVSTYLRRAKGAPAAAGEVSGPIEGRAAAPPAAVAAPATTALWRVGAGTGKAYAAVSGDRNPIHMSRLGARVFGFPRPIAHGMWTMARALAALEGKLADTYTIDVIFRRPLPLPATVAWAERRDSDGWTIGVTEPVSGKEYLTGSIAPA